MYHKRNWTDRDDLAWCFSAPLGGPNMIYPDTNPWALSTYQFEEFSNGMQSMMCQITGNLLYAFLNQLEMRGICENKNCILNNADSVGEAEDCAHLILCPLCLRKMHLGGIIQDVPAFLNRLSGVLQEEPFATFCKTDLEVLLKWGYEWPSKKKKTS